MSIGLEELESNPRALVDSPRTLEACRREGVLPTDLQRRKHKAHRRKSITEMREDFFEKKRLELIEEVRKTREKLIAEEEERSETESVNERAIMREWGKSQLTSRSQMASQLLGSDLA